MERTQQHRQVVHMRQSLFDQGLLDEQFVQLEELQDDANPNFVEEVVTLFYRDSARLVLNIDQALNVCPENVFKILMSCCCGSMQGQDPSDFSKLDSYMHQFKGSASSIGAKKVKGECTLFREYCKAGNGEGCMKTFQQLKKDYAVLRKKLEAYFQVIFHSLLFEKMVKIEESDSKMCTLLCLLSSQSIHLLSFSLMIQLARQVGPVETACRRK
ncbi:Histidine-containing phosphotransfer protein 4 [Vitis vinifera]|uniref:Histidine-containing phosphotransfer protein n=1 Tax=Vitis vinifera TaxID=29760 RepID=A0A438CZA8_VITVI|nr:Histidine-containing phosphotransfer protein 4 [Vitis vinifera]